MEQSKLSLCFSLLSLLVLLSSSSSDAVGGAPQVPCYFIFGDSLVDNGNNLYRDTDAKVNYLPYGIDFSAGPTGRFTNGRTVVDIIAELLGFEKYIPPYANVTNEAILRGVNYGSGGAGILDETGRQLGNVISFNEQLSNHEAAVSRMAKLLGSESVAKQHLSECIYSVLIGSNDYLTNYLPQFYSSATNYTPQQFAALLITQFAKQLRKLYDSGARKVGVFGLGKLGCVPQELANYGASDGSTCVETSNSIVQIFNENLKLLLNDFNNNHPEAKFLVVRDSSSATSYGNIRFLTDPCCGTSTEIGGGQCLPETVPCGNREEYMFWDLFHPTEAANFISANIAYADMSPLYYAAASVDVW